MERGEKENKLLCNILLKRNTYFEKGLKQLVEALEGCFLIFKSSRVFGEINVVFSGSETDEPMVAQRDKGNHKNSFLTIVPKHICGGLVGANSPSLITAQARGSLLASQPDVPSRYWICSPPPTGFPEAFICCNIPTLLPPLPAFQANLASGFSLLLFPFVFVYFH